MPKANKKPRVVAHPAIILRETGEPTQTSEEPGESDTSSFLLELSGIAPGSTIELTFWETNGTDEGEPRPDRELGKMTGVGGRMLPVGHIEMTPSGPLATAEEARSKAPKKTSSSDGNQAPPKPKLVSMSLDTPEGRKSVWFAIENESADKTEGDSWEIVVKAKVQSRGKTFEFSSPPRPVARLRRSLAHNAVATYPPRIGNRFHLYNDGCKTQDGGEGAFADIVNAIGDAQGFVFVADWSFHPLFRPSRVGPAETADPANSIGALLLERAKSDVTVAIHTWDHTGAGAKDVQNDCGEEVFEAIFRATGGDGELPPSLHWMMSSRGGASSPSDYVTTSHHQKMVVCDYYDKTHKRHGIRVFLGGLDLTEGRLDHPGHPVGPPPQGGRGDAETWTYAQQWSAGKWSTDEWYNAETGGDRSLPRQPWHDVHARLEGPAAWDYLREFVGRWLAAKGALVESTDPIWKCYTSLFDRTTVIPAEEPLEDGTFTVQVCRSIMREDWAVHIPARTMPSMPRGRHWSGAYAFDWRLKEAHENSIAQAYEKGIKQAERFLYIENQYFIGSGSQWGNEKYDACQNRVPELLVERIVERRKAGAPFHVYVVMPMLPEGNPTAPYICELRACQWETAQYMISTLGADWNESLSFYFLANWKSVSPSEWWKATDYKPAWSRNEMLRAHERYMIYVHSKLLIADDRYVILGSANLNDRSLIPSEGDTEIVTTAWPMLRKQSPCVKAVQDFRRRLWVEHLGEGSLPEAWQTPEAPDCWRMMCKKGLENYWQFRQMKRSSTAGHLCLFNYGLEQDKKLVMQWDAPTTSNVKAPMFIGPEAGASVIADAPLKSLHRAMKGGWGWEGRFKTFMPRSLVK